VFRLFRVRIMHPATSCSTRGLSDGAQQNPLGCSDLSPAV
jgi:hypothetical protein